MADVSFVAFVEDVLTGKNGPWAVKTAEAHSRKDENGQWQTVARTFRTVKAAYETPINFGQFAKGDKVRVVGKESTEVREYQGKKYYDLIVKADSVEPFGQQSAPAPAGGAYDTPAWDTPASDETPF
jgi:hypothetical protein